MVEFPGGFEFTDVLGSASEQEVVIRCLVALAVSEIVLVEWPVPVPDFIIDCKVFVLRVLEGTMASVGFGFVVLPLRSSAIELQRAPGGAAAGKD